MENKEVVYFSVNNWMCGENYPPLPCFKKWLGDDLNQNFRSDEWCKENKLCVYYGVVDMSQNYTVSAPREWVEKNCPELLTDDEFTYITRTGTYKKKNIFSKDVELVWEDVEHEENFGSEYYETYWWGDDDEDEDSDEDDED